MRPNPVKRALRAGETVLGTMVFEFDTPGLCRLAAGAGAEFVLFDTEHTGWSVETIRRLIATCPPLLVPLVRIPATEYHFIARLLDVGAMGLMVPMVESEEQAQLVVASAKYPPTGRRGAGFGLAHDDFAPGDILEGMRLANEEGLLIAQIETARGVAAVDRIAAVEGIDVLWIGHFDLTNSLGIPGQFTHPQFVEAVDKVREACQQHDKALGFMASGVEEARALLGQGFRILAYGRDLALYQQALRTGLEALRTGGKD